MTDIQKQIQEYGTKIDNLAKYQHDDQLLDLLEEAKRFSSESASKDPALPYFIGTGYSILAYHKRAESCDLPEGADKKALLSNVDEYNRLTMYFFRMALSLLPSTDLHLHSRILTNYANTLDSCGRVIEALKTYREAIAINSKFGMAVANYGLALQFLANIVNDPGHKHELHCNAYQIMKKGLVLRDGDFHDDAIIAFEKHIKEYELLPIIREISKPIIYQQYDLGTGKEKEYRKWCLRHHLYLNPLNELIELESAFAHDPLTITSFTENIEESDSSGAPPRWFSMLNQLKQEYAYARYLCFEGSENIQGLHYADKGVQLSLSSYDYVNYSVRIEQLKTAFRNLYAIYDQIAYFINDFWKIGLKEKQADAKHVFHHEGYPRENLALNALYWCHCEFHEKYGDADAGSEQELADLRNAFEHKFVKVHEYWDKGLKLEKDNFYHIGENKLVQYTIRSLELSREALMYLVYAIELEEKKKPRDKNIVRLNIVDFDDDWKL